MKCSPMRASSVLGLCLALSACVAAAADPAGAQTMKVTIEGRRGGDISATTAEIAALFDFEIRPIAARYAR